MSPASRRHQRHLAQLAVPGRAGPVISYLTVCPRVCPIDLRVNTVFGVETGVGDIAGRGREDVAYSFVARRVLFRSFLQGCNFCGCTLVLGSLRFLQDVLEVLLANHAHMITGPLQNNCTKLQ